MNELPSALHADIKLICADGDALAERRLYEEAITTYNKAWKLVPAPQTDWETSTWVLAAIGDACFLGGFFTSGQRRWSTRCAAQTVSATPSCIFALANARWSEGKMKLLQNT